MDKIFSCVWLEASYGSNSCTLENLYFFTESNGYDSTQYEIIYGLKIGESLVLDNANHFITRVK